MPISSRVIKTFANDVSATSFSITGGSNGVDGEFLVAFLSWSYEGDYSATVTLSGWTELVNGNNIGNTFTPNVKFFYKWADNEPSSYTATKGSGTHNFSVAITAHTQVDTTSPFAGSTPVLAAGGRASGTAPSYTPTAQPCRVFWFMAHQNYRAASDNAIAWTGATELFDVSHVFNVSSLAYEDRTSTAATGTRAWSISPYGGNTDSLVTALALREAVAIAPTGPEPGRFLMSG